MSVFQVIAVLLTLTALFSYLNYRFIRLPTTIGVMLIALIASLALIALQHFGFSIGPMAGRVLQSVDFGQTLLQGMLSFLLFAGALHINLNDLAKQKWVITILAVVGVLISTFVFGTATYFVLAWLSLKLSYVWCLLFGALISPTDPIAVLGILKSARVPKSLEIQIAGESLFNDGIGVVVSLVLYEIAVRGDQPSFTHISTVFLEEAVGGAVVGLLLGWITYRLLKAVDQYRRRRHHYLRDGALPQQSDNKQNDASGRYVPDYGSQYWETGAVGHCVDQTPPKVEARCPECQRAIAVY